MMMITRDGLGDLPVGRLDVVQLRRSGYVSVKDALGADDAVDGGGRRVRQLPNVDLLTVVVDRADAILEDGVIREYGVRVALELHLKQPGEGERGREREGGGVRAENV